jgi:hypothetical protein
MIIISPMTILFGKWLTGGTGTENDRSLPLGRDVWGKFLDLHASKVTAQEPRILEVQFKCCLSVLIPIDAQLDGQACRLHTSTRATATAEKIIKIHGHSRIAALLVRL